jgi:AcrR family transcriptional regulator
VRQRHSRQDLLDAAVALCLREGLAQLTFGKVARAAAVPDRTVVYYFADKERLLEAVMDVLAARVLTLVDDGSLTTRLPAQDLPAQVWPRLAGPEGRDVMAVWMELFARGGTRQEPYQRVARRLAQAWLGWLADRVDAPTPQARAQGAARALAVLDGALLLRHVGLEAEADAAVAPP